MTKCLFGTAFTLNFISKNPLHNRICSVLGVEVLSKSTCEYWFRRFLAGNFVVNDLKYSWATSKVKFVDLQALLDTDFLQTQQNVHCTLRNI